MILQILEFVLALALVSSLLIGILHWHNESRRLREARRLGIDAACMQCGYPARGWSSSLCPECGTDIRIAGIRAGRRRLGPVCLFIALMIAAGAMLLMKPIALRHFERVQVFLQRDFETRPRTENHPTYATQLLPGYHRAHLACRATFDEAFAWQEGTVVLTLEGLGETQVMKFTRPSEVPEVEALIQALVRVSTSPVESVDPAIAADLQSMIHWCVEGRMLRRTSDSTWTWRGLDSSSDLYWAASGTNQCSSSPSLAGQIVVVGATLAIFLLVFIPLLRATRVKSN